MVKLDMILFFSRVCGTLLIAHQRRLSVLKLMLITINQLITADLSNITFADTNDGLDTTGGGRNKHRNLKIQIKSQNTIKQKIK